MDSCSTLSSPCPSQFYGMHGMALPACWMPKHPDLAIFSKPLETVKAPSEQSDEASYVAFECRRESDAGSADNWVQHLCRKTFFCPCDLHKHKKKNECTFFCLDMPAQPAMCSFCMPSYAHLRTLQIRRYVYRDVVKQVDVMKYMDVSGIQTYIINQAKVVFITAKGKAAAHYPRYDGACSCQTCGRSLREGFLYCSLACKVDRNDGANTLLALPLQSGHRCGDNTFEFASTNHCSLSPSSSLKDDSDLWHPAKESNTHRRLAVRVKEARTADENCGVIFARNCNSRRKQAAPCRASN